MFFFSKVTGFLKCSVQCSRECAFYLFLVKDIIYRLDFDSDSLSESKTFSQSLLGLGELEQILVLAIVVKCLETIPLE